MLSLSAPTAGAETEDVVRKLDVTYAVQKDGTVDVSYRLDWDFGETGAHGIELSLVTSETWENDPTKQAVYDVSDLKVSSPTGVPTDVESYEDDITGTLELRIGDPDTELDVDRATYLVTYTLDGAMRTFDGNPQLYWDVTSSDFPTVEAFTVTVTGPSAIPRARCLQGSDECDAEVSGKQAVLSGSQAESSQTITAVAEFEPDSIRNAEPSLQERELYEPALVAMDSTVTVGSDGVAHVEERLTVRSTARNLEIAWDIPQRRRLSWNTDQVFAVTDFSASTADGTALPVSHRTISPGASRQRDQIEAELPEGSEKSETVDVLASYTVRGATVSDGSGPASFSWPISTFDSREYDIPASEHVTWKLPGPVSGLDCRYQDDLDDPDGRCALADELATESDSATFEQSDEDGLGPGQWVMIDFAADSVPLLAPTTEWSRVAKGWTITGVVIASVLIFPVLGWLLTRIGIGGARDQRYLDVPPGTIGSNKRVGTSRLGGPIPVRFSPPDASPSTIGLVLDRRSRPRHLTATLINMAVNEAVRLQSEPLAIWQQDSDRLTSSFEERIYWRLSTEDGSGAVSDKAKRKLSDDLKLQYTQAKRQGDLLRTIPVKQASSLLYLVLPVLMIAAGATAAGITGSIGWLPTGIGVAALLIGGTIFGLVRRRPARSAKATALAEQAIGFGEYLRTAESSELNADAEADIYRRYLPWAVLFDEVDRWTKVCQQWASAGQIDAPDTAFIGGLSSVGNLSQDLSRFTKEVQPRPTGGGGSGSGSGSGSWGGSGGSSGFSGGASGGGGGGGTSAGSW